MRKKIALILAAMLFLSIVPFGCGLGGYSTVIREVPENTYDASDTTLFKQTEGAPQKTIQYIDMDGKAYTDLFLATSFQGLVNRENPFLYVIHDEIVEGQGSRASQYWFDKLDETYAGDAAYQKVEKTDIYGLVKENLSKVKGYVLYHERLTDVEMVSRYASNSIYSDIAVLNLTVMLCGQYDAIPLTAEQVRILKEDYDVELSKLGDTTQFMRDGEGNISSNRSDRAVWSKVYTYAMTKFKGKFADDALMHNPGFQPAHFDFAVAHKMFVFNRILDADSTEAERSMEKRFYNLSESNTLVYGCWYLQMDEPGFMATVSSNGKMFVGTYESYNLTWTSALPKSEFPRKDETKLTLDENKVYVAFDFSEGDFNSYVQFKMKGVYDDEGRGTVPISISIQPSLTESNPNIVKYFSDNWADGDNFVMAEAGSGYLPTPPEDEVAAQYYAITQEYMNRNDMDCIRMLSPEQDEPLRYAENLDGLSAMMLGYMGESNFMVNDNEQANFLYRDTVYFKHYFCDQMDIIKNYSDSAPGFFSVSMAGWNYLPSTIKQMMEGFDDRFQVVTTTQLADLYKQYYGKDFKNVKSADFNAGLSREEMGFLHYASNHKSYDKLGGSRYAEGDDYFVYKFDLDDSAKKAYLDLDLFGAYRMEVSTDYRKWYVVDNKTLDGKTNVGYDLSEFTGKNKDNTVYVRFQSKAESSVELYSARLSTDLEKFGTGTLNASNDRNFLADGYKGEEGMRTGSFTYKLPFDQNAAVADFAMKFDGEKSVEISRDGRRYQNLPLTLHGNTAYARADLTDKNDKTVWLRFSGEGNLEQLKYNAEDKKLTGLILTPNDLTAESKYFLSTDFYDLMSGQNYSKRVGGGNELVYKFRFDPTVANLTLRLAVSGQFKVSASGDNKTFTDVIVSDPSETYDPTLVLNVKDKMSADGYLYLKIASPSVSRTTTVTSMLFLTDKSTKELRSVVEKRRSEDLVIRPEQNGAGLEGDLVWQNNGSYIFHGYGYGRVTDSNQSFVYKLDFSKANETYWKALSESFDSSSLTRVKIGFDVCNQYKISVSTDGVNFTEFANANNNNVQDGSNRKTVNYIKEFAAGGEKVLYFKFEDSNKLDAGWGTILYGTYFYFN